MSDKVVHIGDSTHAAMMVFCRARGLRARDWVSGLIEQALDGSKAPRLQLVNPKKTLDPVPESTGAEPWAAPPFWSGRP